MNVSSSSRHRVLVVDDYPDTADIVRTLVERFGHDARVANTGRSALAEAYDFVPTVVILDIGLSDMSGCDVARQLRARRGGERMFIAALSGWGQPERRRAAIEAGCDRFLLKPASGQKVQEILGLHEPARQLKA